MTEAIPFCAEIAFRFRGRGELNRNPLHHPNVVGLEGLNLAGIIGEQPDTIDRKRLELIASS